MSTNIQRGRGDTTASKYLVRQFADRFWRAEWPGTRRSGVYYDLRAPEGPAGVLHAKAVVGDDAVVFVTSANLTEAALQAHEADGRLRRQQLIGAIRLEPFDQSGTGARRLVRETSCVPRGLPVPPPIPSPFWHLSGRPARRRAGRPPSRRRGPGGRVLVRLARCCIK